MIRTLNINYEHVQAQLDLLGNAQRQAEKKVEARMESLTGLDQNGQNLLNRYPTLLSQKIASSTRAGGNGIKPTIPGASASTFIEAQKPRWLNQDWNAATGAPVVTSGLPPMPPSGPNRNGPPSSIPYNNSGRNLVGSNNNTPSVRGKNNSGKGSGKGVNHGSNPGSPGARSTGKGHPGSPTTPGLRPIAVSSDFNENAEETPNMRGAHNNHAAMRRHWEGRIRAGHESLLGPNRINVMTNLGNGEDEGVQQDGENDNQHAEERGRRRFVDMDFTAVVHDDGTHPLAPHNGNPGEELREASYSPREEYDDGTLDIIRRETRENRGERATPVSQRSGPPPAPGGRFVGAAAQGGQKGGQQQQNAQKGGAQKGGCPVATAKAKAQSQAAPSNASSPKSRSAARHTIHSSSPPPAQQQQQQQQQPTQRPFLTNADILDAKLPSNIAKRLSEDAQEKYGPSRPWRQGDKEWKPTVPKKVPKDKWPANPTKEFWIEFAKNPLNPKMPKVPGRSKRAASLDNVIKNRKQQIMDQINNPENDPTTGRAINVETGLYPGVGIVANPNPASTSVPLPPNPHMMGPGNVMPGTFQNSQYNHPMNNNIPMQSNMTNMGFDPNAASSSNAHMVSNFVDQGNMNNQMMNNNFVDPSAMNNNFNNQNMNQNIVPMNNAPMNNMGPMNNQMQGNNMGNVPLPDMNMNVLQQNNMSNMNQPQQSNMVNMMQTAQNQQMQNVQQNIGSASGSPDQMFAVPMNNDINMGQNMNNMLNNNMAPMNNQMGGNMNQMNQNVVPNLQNNNMVSNMGSNLNSPDLMQQPQFQQQQQNQNNFIPQQQQNNMMQNNQIPQNNNMNINMGQNNLNTGIVSPIQNMGMQNNANMQPAMSNMPSSTVASTVVSPQNQNNYQTPSPAFTLEVEQSTPQNHLVNQQNQQQGAQSPSPGLISLSENIQWAEGPIPRCTNPRGNEVNKGKDGKHGNKGKSNNSRKGSPDEKGKSNGDGKDGRGKKGVEKQP